MSSPTSRRSQRNSSTATPARSTRNSQVQLGSPSGVMADQEQQIPTQATPRASRQGVPSSSPLFFRSSPVVGRTVPSGATDAMDLSSPLKHASTAIDGDRTPRGPSRAIAGSKYQHRQTIARRLTLHYPRFVAHTVRFKLKSYTRIERWYQWHRSATIRHSK